MSTFTAAVTNPLVIYFFVNKIRDYAEMLGRAANWSTHVWQTQKDYEANGEKQQGTHSDERI